MTFGAVSIAFIGLHPHQDMLLASNKVFTLVVVLVIYWIATSIAMKGLNWVGKISKIGGLVGTIIPAGLLILLGVIYLASGGHNNMNMSVGVFPDLTKFDNLVLASGIFLFYAGMEMMGIHVMDVKNPSKNYPKAIFIGSLITVCIFVLGTFSLGFIIPAKEINLTQSLLIGFDNYFQYLRMSWASPIIAVALDVRGAGRSVDMGSRSVERYLYGGQSGLSASVFPKVEQGGCTTQYSDLTGSDRDGSESVVRGHAVGAVLLPDSLSVDRTVVSDHVPVDVRLGHCSAVQDAETATAVPYWQGQLPDLDHRRFGIFRVPVGLCAEFHPARTDCDGQQYRFGSRY